MLSCWPCDLGLCYVGLALWLVPFSAVSSSCCFVVGCPPCLTFGVNSCFLVLVVLVWLCNISAKKIAGTDLQSLDLQGFSLRRRRGVSKSSWQVGPVGPVGPVDPVDQQNQQDQPDQQDQLAAGWSGWSC